MSSCGFIRPGSCGSSVGAPWNTSQERWTLVALSGPAPGPTAGRGTGTNLLQEGSWSPRCVERTHCATTGITHPGPKQAALSTRSAPACTQLSRAPGSAPFVDCLLVAGSVEIHCAATDPCPVVRPCLERVTGSVVASLLPGDRQIDLDRDDPALSVGFRSYGHDRDTRCTFPGWPRSALGCGLSRVRERVVSCGSRSAQDVGAQRS